MQVRMGGPPGDRTRNPRIKRTSGGCPEACSSVRYRRSDRPYRPFACHGAAYLGVGVAATVAATTHGPGARSTAPAGPRKPRWAGLAARARVSSGSSIPRHRASLRLGAHLGETRYLVSAPPAFSLDQHQLDGHLLDRLGQPGHLGLGQLEFVVPLPGLHAGFGRLDAASAASAPSFATVRIRMIVDRSTCSAAAASAIVTSRRTSRNQISYFSEGDRNRLVRRL